MGDGDGVPTLYKAKPPDWLSEVHKNADLGYLGFHPPHPDQEEDLLSEKFIKEGFSATSVPAETFSALGFAKDEISESRLISHLQDVINRVFSRNQSQSPSLPPSSFKLPGRATVNEQRRSAWIKDLANPNIPLPKLGRSVPSGFKGHDLLDMLQTNNIATSRAIWYIRVLGGNETQGMRNRPSFNPMQYSAEWCNNMTSYLKKLISEIALPSPPRAGISIKQVFKSSFLEAEARERWVEKCTYFLDILHGCYCEGLVDQSVFLFWLSGQLSSSVSTLPQLTFICRLAEEYIEGIAQHRLFSRNFLSDCLARLLELESHSLLQYLESTIATLRSLICRLFIYSPDSFVCSFIWKRYATTLRQFFGTSPRIPWNISTTKALNEKFEGIEQRNKALLFISLPEREPSPVLPMIDDVKMLNSISPTFAPSSLNFFCDGSKFWDKLDLLLVWCITPEQHGDHRIYAAASLLSNWRTLEEAKLNLSSQEYDPRKYLQDLLFDWLESSAMPYMSSYTPDIARLFGELIRRDLFSYHKYLQRLIARCEVLELSRGNRSLHSEFLQNIPITNLDAAAVQQRKIILYGHRARDTPEDCADKALRQEFASVLPNFHSEQPLSAKQVDVRTLKNSMGTILNSSVYKVSHALRNSLIPAVYRDFKRSSETTVNVDGYRIMFELVIETKCFDILLEILIHMLRHSGPLLLANPVVDILIRFADIWAAMECKQELAEAVYIAVSRWRYQDVDFRPMMNLVKILNLLSSMSPSGSDELAQYWTSITETLRPAIPDAIPVPLTLPEVLLLAQDSQLDSARLLATSMWSKYKASGNLGWVLWDNAFASVRQIPALFADAQSRHQCALKYADFLYQVNGYLPGDFDDQVQNWLGGSGQSELRALPAEIWELLVVVVEELMTRDVLRSATIFNGILYLTWQIASASTPVSLIDVTAMLKATNRLSWRILSCVNENDEDLLSFQDFQHLASERKQVFSGSVLHRLVECIPRLVKIENDMRFDESLKGSLKELRLRFTSCKQFRSAVSVELDSFRKIFIASLLRDGSDSSSRSKIVAAGKLILNETQGSSLLSNQTSQTELDRSYWRFAKTAIEIQLTLHQYAIPSEDSSVTGDNGLQTFVDSFFQSLSSQETDLLAGVTKGLTTPLRTKFLIAGLKRLKTSLQTLDLRDSTSIRHFTDFAGERLRMLSQLTEPWAKIALSCSEEEVRVQEEFFSLLATTIQAILPSPGSQYDDSAPSPECVRALQIVLIRLLQFALAFAHTWTQRLKVALGSFALCMIRTLVVLGSADDEQSQLFAILFDTTCYCLDESNQQDTPDDAEFVMHELPHNLPDSCRSRLAPLLKFTPRECHTYDLAHLDAKQVDRAPMMQARPWEWLDQPELNPDFSDTGFRNNTAVSFDAFNTNVTLDRVIARDQSAEEIGNVMSTFQDALYSLPLFERAWRETRVVTQPFLPTGTREQALMVSVEKGLDHVPAPSNSVHASPAASSLSRSSGATSVGSWKHSPGQRPPSAGSVVDMESLPSIASTTRAGKRKSTSSTGDSSIAQPSGPSKRPKGGKTTRGKGKKK